MYKSAHEKFLRAIDHMEFHPTLHIPLPLVTLVTSTNKSVRLDVRTMREIGKNGKQYLNIV